MNFNPRQNNCLSTRYVKYADNQRVANILSTSSLYWLDDESIFSFNFLLLL